MKKTFAILVGYSLCASATFAATISSASVGATYANLTQCQMSSSGASVTCMLNEGAKGITSTTASATAAFGDLTVNASSSAASGDASAADALASFDQFLLLPGSGAATITGLYLFIGSRTPPGQASGNGFVNQAGILQATLPFSPAGTPLSIVSTIQLGVPFEVMAQISTHTSAPPNDLASDHLVLTGFRDASGNVITPQQVAPIPEPQLTVLVAAALLCLIAGRQLHRRKLNS